MKNEHTFNKTRLRFTTPYVSDGPIQIRIILDLLSLLLQGTPIYLPFGITPGSINVARVKLANTKNVITPCIAGIHG